MNMEITETVGLHAAAYPSSKRVFEKLGIDYCCGGKISIQDACDKTGVNIDDLAELLRMAEHLSSETAEPDFPGMSLAALADHIVRKHHVFTRDENERITALLEKVCGVHGQNHPELHEVRVIFGMLRLELENHMLKEERMLFPYIALMESSLDFGLTLPPAPFGTTRNPVSVMLSEHDAAAEQLLEIRRLTDDFDTPADACVTYRTLYEALEGLDKDLHQHIHLENNILFPKAIEMEDRKEISGARWLQQSVCGIHADQ
jgi:regulator of cell morphogenesis and NO signaling